MSTGNNVRGAALLCALLSTAAQAQLTNQTVTLPGGGVQAEVFTVPARSIRLQVLSASQLKRLEGADGGIVSLQAVSQAASMRSSIVSRSRGPAFLIMSAGTTDSRVERPEGLLVSGGRASSIPDFSRNVPQQGSCGQKRGKALKLGGLLCVRPNKDVALTRFSSEAAAGCMDAMQLGPLLVDEGEVATCASDDLQPAERSAVCVARAVDNTDIHHFVATRSPVSLLRFAEWLRLPADSGGLACRIAVNLSEEGMAGVAFFGANRSSMKNPNMLLGNKASAQPAFITITTR